jgi:hypothetical protein
LLICITGTFSCRKVDINKKFQKNWNWGFGHFEHEKYFSGTRTFFFLLVLNFTIEISLNLSEVEYTFNGYFTHRIQKIPTKIYPWKMCIIFFSFLSQPEFFSKKQLFNKRKVHQKCHPGHNFWRRIRRTVLFWGWTGNLGFLWWIKIKNSRKESAREKNSCSSPFFEILLCDQKFSFFCDLKSFICNFERLERKFFQFFFYQNA